MALQNPIPVLVFSAVWRDITEEVTTPCVDPGSGFATYRQKQFRRRELIVDLLDDTGRYRSLYPLCSIDQAPFETFEKNFAWLGQRVQDPFSWYRMII